MNEEPAPRGSRWEPTAAPLLPPARPPAATAAATPRALRHGRRGRLAGGAAAMVLAAGLGGFALGHATAPAGPDVPDGSGGPGAVQQDGHHGLPGDQRFSDDDGSGLPPPQSPGHGDDGHST